MLTPEAVRVQLASLDPDARIDVEERAAIMEYDGGLSREAAEREALAAYQREQARGQRALFSEVIP